MPCGAGLPKAQTGVGCRVSVINAPAGTPAVQIWPDPTDQINALAIGAPFTSTTTTGSWQCVYAGVGLWTVTTA